MDNTTSRRGFLQAALGGAAAAGATLLTGDAVAGQRKGAAQDYSGVQAFAKLQRYDRHIGADTLELSEQQVRDSKGNAERADSLKRDHEVLQNAVEASAELGANYTVVIPERINTLMHRRNPKPDGSLTEVSLARELAESAGLSELADAIQKNITSTHFSDRLTADQIAERNISRDFGNPTLYQLKVVNNETGAEGTINVGLENFHEVGMALENLNRLGHGQSIQGQKEFNRAQREGNSR